MTLLFFPTNRFASGESTVVTSKVDDTLAINLGFYEGDTFLTDFSQAKTFNVAIESTSLGTYPLTQSGKAIALLRECAIDAAIQGAEGDPFNQVN